MALLFYLTFLILFSVFTRQTPKVSDVMIIIVSSEFQRLLAPLARCPLSSSLWDLADKDLNVKAETVLNIISNCCEYLSDGEKINR